ncbi:hypothetical protein KY285_035259 [Solanum tuberosum]|nr:hypothetical protein KY285_035259 [Solanum tuberosum]
MILFLPAPSLCVPATMEKHGSIIKKEMVDLRALLTQCAQAIMASYDSRTANELLMRIREHSSSHGDGTERLAHNLANVPVRHRNSLALPCEDEDRKFFKEEVHERDAMNVIACEGTERVERPEMYKQSQIRCDRAGFKQLPLDPEIVKIVQGFLS